MVAGRPSGSSRMPPRIALGEADLVQQLVGEPGIVVRPPGRILGLEQLGVLHDRVIRGLGEAEKDNLIELVAIDGHRQRPAKADVAHQFAPHLVIGVQVGIEGDLRAHARLPQVHGDAR